ncbi:MAG: hypothetical protein AAF993_19120 [Pseudomonadota bacterium]
MSKAGSRAAATGILCATLLVSASATEITGDAGDNRLEGTPQTDYFVGGPGADIFVINYLSEIADEIEDFSPEQGDLIELTFKTPSGLPLQSEHLSINRKGVVKIRLGAKEHDVVDLNRADLRLQLEPRKGRYFLKFTKKL